MIHRIDCSALHELARVHQAYPVLSCREGGQSFRLAKGQLVHSAYDPWSEARRQLSEAGVGAGSTPLILGAGLGYQAVASLEAGASKVLLLEADPRALATLAAMPWADGLLADSRVELILVDSDQQFTTYLSRKMADLHNNHPLLTLAAIPELWQELLPGAANLVRDILSRRLNSHAQESSLAWNREQNSQFLKTSAELQLYHGAWKEKTVVICGAGPSLDRSLTELRNHRAEFKLITVNASLSPLLAAGIQPDLCVAVDGMNVIQADLPVKTSSIPLLWMPSTNHGFVAGWPGARIVALPAGPGLRETAWRGQTPGTLQTGMGTVIGPALDAASQLSEGTLKLCGVDLGSSGAQQYAARVRRQSVEGIRSDFAYMQRQLGTFVQELRLKGRQVSAFGAMPQWLEELPTFVRYGVHSKEQVSCL